MDLLLLLVVGVLLLIPLWLIVLTVLIWSLWRSGSEKGASDVNGSLQQQLNNLESSVKQLRQELRAQKRSDSSSTSYASEDAPPIGKTPSDHLSPHPSTEEASSQRPADTGVDPTPPNWVISRTSVTKAEASGVFREGLVPADHRTGKSESDERSTTGASDPLTSELPDVSSRSKEEEEKSEATDKPETTERTVSWEQYLGKRVLPILGAVILLVGILFFVQLTFQHMSKLARVSVVSAAGILMVGTGEYLRLSSRYELFIPPVIATGWSILYFSAYASYGVEQTQVVETPLIAFVGMLLIAALFVGYTMYRSFHRMAVYGVFLSYGSLFIHLFLFGGTSLSGMFYTLLAVCLLNSSVVVLYALIRSEHVMLCGMGMSYLFFFFLLSQNHLIGTDVSKLFPVAPANILLGALGFSWILMQVPTYLQSGTGRITHIVSALNNILFPLVFSLHLNDFHPDYLSSFFFVIGPIMIAHVVLEEYRENDFLGTMYAIFSTVAIAIGIWYSSTGYYRSFWWLLEASALLGLGTVLRRSDFADLGFATYLLAGTLLLETAVRESTPPALLFESPIESGQFLYVMAAAFGYAMRSTRHHLKTKRNRYGYNLIAGWMGAVFLWTGVWYTLPITTISLGWAVCGIVLLELTYARDDVMFFTQSGLFLSTAAGYLFFIDFPDTQILHLPVRAVAFAVVGGITAYAWWSMENDTPEEVGTWRHWNMTKRLLGIAATGLFAMLIWNESTRLARTPLLTGLFLILFGIRELGYKNALRLPEAGMFIAILTDAIALGLMHELHPSLDDAYRWSSLLTPALLFLSASIIRLNRFTERTTEDQGKTEHLGANWPLLLSFASAFLVGYTCYVELSHEVLTVAWGVTGMLYLIPGMYFQKSTLRYPGLSVLGICTGKIALVDLPDLELAFRILSFVGLGVVLIFASFLYFYFDRILSHKEQ